MSEEDLRRAPNISSLMKLAKGGLQETLEAMRFSENEAVKEFLDRYDMIPARDRASLPWEAIALAADVDPTTLLGATILAIQAYSASAVKIIALSHHPEVMKNRVEFARMPGGERDRHAIDTGLGFLPTAKGSTFIINPGNSQQALPGAVVEQDEPDSEDFDHMFPVLSKTQQTLVPLRARLLEDR